MGKVEFHAELPDIYETIKPKFVIRKYDVCRGA